MNTRRQRGNWNTSDRRQRLPDDWQRRRAIVRDRAHNRCQAEHHAPGCDGTGTDCDHIIAGDNHNLNNLQWLSHACHAAKTRQENARRNHENANLRRHPRERNPGTIPPPPPGGEGLPAAPLGTAG